MFKQRLHTLREIRLLRYLVVGVINTIFSYVVYALLLKLGLVYYLAVLLSTIIGVAFNFKTTGSLVFRSRSNRLIFRFYAVYSVYYVINVTCLTLLKRIVPDPYLAQLLLLLPLAMVSYLMMRQFVFKQQSL